MFQCKKAQPKEVMLPVNLAKGKNVTRSLGELLLMSPQSQIRWERLPSYLIFFLKYFFIQSKILPDILPTVYPAPRPLLSPRQCWLPPCLCPVSPAWYIIFNI